MQNGYVLIANRVKLREHIDPVKHNKNIQTGRLEYNGSNLKFTGKDNEIIMTHIESLSKVKAKFNFKFLLRRTIFYLPIFILFLFLPALKNNMPDLLQEWVFLLSALIGLTLMAAAADEWLRYYCSEWIKVNFTDSALKLQEVYLNSSVYDEGTGKLFKKLLQVQAGETSYSKLKDRKWIRDSVLLGFWSILSLVISVFFIRAILFNKSSVNNKWQILFIVIVVACIVFAVYCVRIMIQIIKRKQDVRTLRRKNR